MPSRKNARTHNLKRRKALEATMRRFRVMSPIAVDGESRIICGNLRWEVAKKMGLKNGAHWPDR